VKLFVKNVAEFLILPLVVLYAIEVMLPSTSFTFRVWEAIGSKSGFLLGPFYPNIDINYIEVGDLVPHSEFAIEKEVFWKTDKLGYRNDSFIATPDILLIGDSNTAGGSLSQEETLTHHLKQATGLAVYNLAPADMNTYISFKNEGVFTTPRLIIYSCIERAIPDLPPIDERVRRKYLDIRLNPLFQFLTVQFDKLYKGNSLEYLKARTLGLGRQAIQSPNGEDMFFIQGAGAVLDTEGDLLNQASARINSYKIYCNSIGCEFVFMAIPNKETIFWELAGLERQPTFVDRLNQKLNSEGTKTIDAVRVFDTLLKQGIVPYHYDDSHWNIYAVKAVAKEIAEM